MKKDDHTKEQESLDRDGKKAGKQNRERNEGNELSFVCFWGLIHADVYKESQSRFSLHFSTDSDSPRTDLSTLTGMIGLFYFCFLWLMG